MEFVKHYAVWDVPNTCISRPLPPPFPLSLGFSYMLYTVTPHFHILVSCFRSVLEEDEVFSVAQLLGDLVTYRSTGTGHLEFLAGSVLNFKCVFNCPSI